MTESCENIKRNTGNKIHGISGHKLSKKAHARYSKVYAFIEKMTAWEKASAKSKLILKSSGDVYD